MKGVGCRVKSETVQKSSGDGVGCDHGGSFTQQVMALEPFSFAKVPSRPLSPSLSLGWVRPLQPKTIGTTSVQATARISYFNTGKLRGISSGML